MSKFLGPIHDWLYGKIGHQEALTTAIARHAQASGWIAEPSAYTKELPALEDVIDTENIHGWLQGQITDAETRYANLVTDVLTDRDDRLAEVLRVCFLFGREHALPPDTDAAQAYQAFESFFVNGMPCDRINTATEQSPETVSWQMARDIHAQYWHRGDSDLYYILRKSVMDGVLADTGFVIDMKDAGHYLIRSK